MGGSSNKQTIGYKYYLGMHMALCHGPVDRLIRIEVGDRVAWLGEGAIGESSGPITVSAPELFGGDEREGGIEGTLDIAFGEPTQTKNSYLQSILGLNIPSFRGVACAILRQVYVGTNPYLKKWGFRMQRIYTRQDGIDQWYPVFAGIPNGAIYGDPHPNEPELDDIHLDMNPVHIIRECLTDPDWGMGYPESDIDDSSFMAASFIVFIEEMGISLLWNRQIPIESFVAEIVKHIDAALYVDRTSGKFVLKLIRDDYSVGGLLVLDESNVEKIDNLSRPSFGELTNSVTVNYWDSVTGENASVTVQDTALVQMQNAVINTTVTYSGFTSRGLASRVALRDLATLSTPLWSATIYTGQDANGLNIGDVFKLSWGLYGLSEVIMRITGIGFGDGKSNKIRINATQDRFYVPSSGSVSSPEDADGWQPLDSTPLACPVRVVTEAPYFELVSHVGQSNADLELNSVPEAGYIIGAGGRPTTETALNALLYVDSGSGYETNDTMDFSPFAYLNGNVTRLQTIVPIDGVVDLDLIDVGQHAQIGTELVRVDAISASSMTIGRGILDTLPQEHLDGDPVLFWDNYPSSDEIQYVDGESVNVKLLTVAGSSTLAEVDAPTDNVVFNARAYRPYPPGDFKINTEYWPEFIEGAIALTWTHRDRIQQTGSAFLDFTDTDVGPETGTTYNVYVYGEDDLLGKTFTGITNNFLNYSLTTEASDFGGRPNGKLRLVVESERDGYSSFYNYDHTFYRVGYGYSYGYSYGGKV